MLSVKTQNYRDLLCEKNLMMFDKGKKRTSSAIALLYDTILEAVINRRKNDKCKNNMYACLKCNKTAKCARCKVVSYCSRECQKAVRFYCIAFLQIHVMMDANLCLALVSNQQDGKNHKHYCITSAMKTHPIYTVVPNS